MISLEDVWAGRDGLLDEVYRLRQENQRLREMIEGTSPWPERIL